MTEKQRIRKAVSILPGWFSENRREYAFRANPTPYRIWVSEVMLQQTRIEAVLPKYEAFLEEAPDVFALASLDDDKLMKLWEGLGYYSRARNLKKAAVLLCEKYRGVFPREAEELKKLPGIGEYTAGAIASIAFGRPEPAVDGNVMRVVSRLLASEKEVNRPEVKKEVASLLRSVYPEGKESALLTEALMEIGESVCIPNGKPDCAACPLRAVCLAKKSGEPARYPFRGEKRGRRFEEITVFLLFAGEKVILDKRPAKGLLAGMWELPNTREILTEREAFAFLTEKGFAPDQVSPCGGGIHLFTHIEWKMTGYLADCKKVPEGYSTFTRRELIEETALPSAFGVFKKKALERLK